MLIIQFSMGNFFSYNFDQIDFPNIRPTKLIFLALQSTQKTLFGPNFLRWRQIFEKTGQKRRPPKKNSIYWRLKKILLFRHQKWISQNIAKRSAGGRNPKKCMHPPPPPQPTTPTNPPPQQTPHPNKTPTPTPPKSAPVTNASA